ncbi:hypothetical protein TNCV_2740831 [Trichonephila clavipes]|nr:hypothetical protein TNCV_2740831 [Trichonephila clavipes]
MGHVSINASTFKLRFSRVTVLENQHHLNAVIVFVIFRRTFIHAGNRKWKAKGLEAIGSLLEGVSLPSCPLPLRKRPEPTPGTIRKLEKPHK